MASNASGSYNRCVVDSSVTRHASEIVGTNRIPSETQVSKIHAVILDTQTRIAGIDAQIVRARAILDSLEAERKLLNDHLEDHKALLSPARRIPPELIAEIFVRCLPRGNVLPTLKSSEAPLLLGKICSSWRAVALSTPRLWCSLSIGFNEKNLLSKMAFAQACFSRCKGLPLALSLSSSQAVFAGSSGEDMISALTAYAPRLQFLELNLPITLLRVFESLPRDSFPALETLVVDTSAGFSQPLTVFQPAPRLQRAQIKCKGEHGGLVDLPWSNLTHLHSNVWLPFTDAGDILRQCGNLQECRITITGGDLDATSKDPIVLPHLNTLHVNAMTAPHSFFDCLTLPALRDFEFRPINPVPWPHQQFLSLLSRSSCPLERLSIVVGHSDDGDLVACLRLIPSLITLDLTLPIQQTFMTNSILEQLTHNNDNGVIPLVPHLERISVRGFGCQYLDINVFADVVSSRWDIVAQPQAVARLTTAQFPCWRCNPVPSGMLRLKEMKMQGLNFIDDESFGTYSPLSF